MSEEYIPQIYMAALAGDKNVDCYFTNGAVKRYDVAQAIDLGGVFAPLADQQVFESSMLVYDGVLCFDIAGTRDPYEMVDICADVIYAEGIDIVSHAA